MRMKLSVIMMVIFGMAFSGCVVTTKNVEVERTDQTVSGNQGFFKGTPPAVSARKATRQHIDVDVELPRVSREARSFEVKDSVTRAKGNPGVAAFPAREAITEEAEIIEEMPQASEEAEVIEEEVAQPASAEPAVRTGGASPKGIQTEVRPVVEAPRSAPVAETAAPSKKYIVQKNDTLEKIAARPEIYGDGKKWYSIYKANKDKLKSPDKIRPGQELTIPPIEREGEKVGSK